MRKKVDRNQLEEINRDLFSLDEIKSALQKAGTDVTWMKQAEKLIDDWIDELERIKQN